MPRVNVKKTIRNTMVEYSIPTIKDKKSSISWIFSVLKSPYLKVKNIALDDLSRSGDEGNYSTTINSQVSERDLLKVCNENDTDVISLTARFGGMPIIIGIDLRSFEPFVTVRNRKQANIELIEQQFNLK